MDIGTGVELECSYGAGDGQTRSGVVTGKSMDMTICKEAISQHNGVSGNEGFIDRAITWS